MLIEFRKQLLEEKENIMNEHEHDCITTNQPMEYQSPSKSVSMTDDKNWQCSTCTFGNNYYDLEYIEPDTSIPIYLANTMYYLS